jgi:SOS response regulatory protein OraA/RecX
MIEKTAVRLLAVKSLSCEELRKKLKLKGFSSHEIESVIKKFTSLGYLNDQEIRERRFQAYLRKGYGPRYVAMKMKEQGLSMPFYPSHLQKQIVLQLLKTAAFKRKNFQKQGAALQRRGFDLEVIYEIRNFFDGLR